MYFKSHHRPKAEYRRVVYLIRDGRDAMMSYYNFINQLHGRTHDLSGMVRDGESLDIENGQRFSARLAERFFDVFQSQHGDQPRNEPNRANDRTTSMITR